MEETFSAFSPRMVEQQITDYLLLPANKHTLVRDLQGYYMPADQHAALQRVWSRFLTQQQTATQPSRSQARIIRLAHHKKYRWLPAPGSVNLARYLGIAAIVMACALALSRLIYVLARQNNQPAVPTLERA